MPNVFWILLILTSDAIVLLIIWYRQLDFQQTKTKLYILIVFNTILDVIKNLQIQN